MFYLVAQVNRPGLTIINLLVFVSFLVGVMAEDNQDAVLFGIFTILNGILGCCIFVFHCSGNEEVRNKLVKAYMALRKKKASGLARRSKFQVLLRSS